MDGWISVNDKFPKEKEFVLCIDKDGLYCVGYRWLLHDDSDGYPEEYCWEVAALNFDEVGSWSAAGNWDHGCEGRDYPDDRDIKYWRKLPQKP